MLVRKSQRPCLDTQAYVVLRRQQGLPPDGTLPPPDAHVPGQPCFPLTSAKSQLRSNIQLSERLSFIDRMRSKELFWSTAWTFLALVVLDRDLRGKEAQRSWTLILWFLKRGKGNDAILVNEHLWTFFSCQVFPPQSVLFLLYTSQELSRPSLPFPC